MSAVLSPLSPVLSATILMEPRWAGGSSSVARKRSLGAEAHPAEAPEDLRLGSSSSSRLFSEIY